jgi:hypothetical protein
MAAKNTFIYGRVLGHREYAAATLFSVPIGHFAKALYFP